MDIEINRSFHIIKADNYSAERSTEITKLRLLNLKEKKTKQIRIYCGGRRYRRTNIHIHA